MADENPVDQTDLEQLLEQAKGGDAPAQTASLEQSEVESLVNQAKDGDGNATQPAAEDGAKVPGQEDIEKLLAQVGKGSEGAPRPAPATFNSPTFAGEGTVPQGDVDYLLEQAEAALRSVESGSGGLPEGIASYQLQEFSGTSASTETATLDLIRDVELDLKIELGRTQMHLEDVLKLRKGSVVPLDKLAGDPVDVYVNGRLVAQGEVLVLNENFCVRVTELIAGTKLGA